MDQKIRIGLADDHPVVREGLKAMISVEPDLEIVGEAETGAEALKLFHACHPEIMVLDLMLPDCHGTEVIRQITAVSSNTQIIVLTSLGGDEDIYRSVEAGARGYLFKDMARKELVLAIRRVAQGKQYISAQVGAALAGAIPRTALSSREVEVLKLVSVGQRNKEIAHQLNIAEATVNVHVKHILDKLGASDRTEAVTVALRRGIIRL
jgi:DNA-binding NarL/FixJ family response regulator